MSRTYWVGIMLAVFLVGCSNQPAFIGKWKKGDGSTIEFFKDGTISMFTFDRIASAEAAGTWKEVDSETLKLELRSFISTSGVVKWRVDGDSLTWTEASGHNESYARVRQP